MKIHRGITRTVLVGRRYAVKLPSLRTYGDGLTGLLWSICRGVLANQSEAEWWRACAPDQKAQLCPVLASWLGGVINIYPRCERFAVTRGVERAMADRRFYPTPTLFPPPSDNKPANYGWLNGRPVLLDYDMNWNACPHERSGAFNGQ